MLDKIKGASNTAMNQAKFISDNTKEFLQNPSTDNVLKFQKKAIQNNPFNSLTFQWNMAKLNKQFFSILMVPLAFQQEYWKMWEQVYDPKGNEQNGQ